MKYIIPLFCCLLFLFVGCVQTEPDDALFQESQQGITDENETTIQENSHIPTTPFDDEQQEFLEMARKNRNGQFYLNREGNLTAVRKDPTWVFHATLLWERCVYAYDWDRFHADHGPFLALDQEFVQKQDGTWIRLPCYESFEYYTAHTGSPQSPDEVYYMTERPSEVTDEVLAKNQAKSLFILFTEAVCTENADDTCSIVGTVAAIVSNPAYQCEYLAEYIETEILYTSIDLSDCNTMDEKIRKLFETCGGNIFQVAGDTWGSLFRAGKYDFTQAETEYVP